MARPKKGQPQETDSPIKKLRLAAGLSQEDLARLTGLSVSTISRWEREPTEPTMTVYQVKAFCKAVNKTLDELPDFLRPPLKSEEDEAK